MRYDLEDLMEDVQAEMYRAAQIHGAEFTSQDQALRAIAEESLEVAMAVTQGNVAHAKIEIIQNIGVLIKLMKGLDYLCGGEHERTKAE